VIDTSAGRKQDLQSGQCSDEFWGCLPGDQIFDLIQITGIRPHSKIKVGRVVGEIARPSRRTWSIGSI
jgi:hypothetical protein